MTSAWDILRGSLEQKIGNAAVFSLFTLGTVLLAGWAYTEWRRKQRPALAVLLIGAVLSILGDAGARRLIGLHTDPAIDHPLIYRAFGVGIAIWMAPVLPVYLATCGYLTYRALQNRWPRNRFWKAIGALIIIEAIGELAMINLARVYSYEGDQPLSVLNLPLVWPAAFVVTGALAGALIYLLGPHLHGVRQLLLVPISAASFFGLLTTLAWPSIVALYAQVTGLAADLLGLLSLANMGCLLYVLTTFMSASAAPPQPPATHEPEAGAPTHRQ